MRIIIPNVEIIIDGDHKFYFSASRDLILTCSTNSFFMLSTDKANSFSISLNRKQAKKLSETIQKYFLDTESNTCDGNIP